MKVLLILAALISFAAHADGPRWGVGACTQYTEVLTWLDKEPSTLSLKESMILMFVEAKDCQGLDPDGQLPDCYQRIREAFKVNCAGFQGATGSPSSTR